MPIMSPVLIALAKLIDIEAPESGPNLEQVGCVPGKYGGSTDVRSRTAHNEIANLDVVIA